MTLGFSHNEIRLRKACEDDGPEIESEIESELESEFACGHVMHEQCSCICLGASLACGHVMHEQCISDTEMRRNGGSSQQPRCQCLVQITNSEVGVKDQLGSSMTQSASRSHHPHGPAHSKTCPAHMAIMHVN